MEAVTETDDPEPRLERQGGLQVRRRTRGRGDEEQKDEAAAMVMILDGSA